MNNKVLVIIGTAEPEKAHAGALADLDVQFVGPLISEAIREGYVPLVW